MLLGTLHSFGDDGVPARFFPAADAQPMWRPQRRQSRGNPSIQVSNTRTPQVSNTRTPNRALKWRVHSSARFHSNQSNVPGSQPRTAIRQVSGFTEINHPNEVPQQFRPTNAQLIDPFDDPFEDKKATRTIQFEELPQGSANTTQLHSSASTTQLQPPRLVRPIRESTTRQGGGLTVDPIDEQCAQRYANSPPYERECNTASCKLYARSICEISLNIDPTRDPRYDPSEAMPRPCPLGNVPFNGRCWCPLTMTWTASSLCHKPLYFEDEKLERYGHSMGPILQPVVSGAHFFANIAVLPYKMGINPPNECRYALGYYRPGSCAPWLLDPIPLSLRGAFYQAAAMTGAAFAIP